MALGAGLAQADAVGRRVTREMARALCLVRGGDCRRDQEPCVTSSEADRSTWTAGILIFRYSHDGIGMLEQQSDGTYAVTVGHASSGGAEGEAGFGGSVNLGKLNASFGGAVTATLLGRLEDSRTWIVGSKSEAQAILKAGGASRAPDRTSSDRAWLPSAGASVEGGVRGLMDAKLKILDAAASWGQHAGTVTDHRTGRQTTYVDAKLSASLSVLEGVLGSATGDANEVYAVERAPDGRPLALRITATGSFAGSRDLPSVVQSIAGRLEVPGAERYEVTATLDLGDPSALDATIELLDDIARKRGRAKPSAELRRLVESSGTVEARMFSTSDATGGEYGAGFDLGTRIVDVSHESEHHGQRLLAAASRGLDGQWIAREDCV